MRTRIISLLSAFVLCVSTSYASIPSAAVSGVTSPSPVLLDGVRVAGVGDGFDGVTQFFCDMMYLFGSNRDCD